MQINKYLCTTYTRCEYITAGKLYKVLLDDIKTKGAAEIFTDKGSRIRPFVMGSAHIGGYPFTVVDTVSAGMSGWL